MPSELGTLVGPVAVALLIALTPGVCVLVLYAIGRVQANLGEIERIEAGERRAQEAASKRKERHADAT